MDNQDEELTFKIPLTSPCTYSFANKKRINEHLIHQAQHSI